MVEAEDPRHDAVEMYRLLIADIYELAGLSRATSEQIARDRGGPTVAQWHVMSVVSDEPRTVPDIADRLGLARQSVQRVVNDLSEIGHVRLRTNPSHKRSSLVELTGSGKHALDLAVSTSEEVRAQQLAAAGISTREMSAARAVVRRLLEALQG